MTKLTNIGSSTSLVLVTNFTHDMARFRARILAAVLLVVLQWSEVSAAHSRPSQMRMCFGLPPLSVFYATCRHTYESTLQEELQRCGVKKDACKVVAPGLLKVSDASISTEAPVWDLTYALQALPNAQNIGCVCVCVTSSSAVAASLCVCVCVGERQREFVYVRDIYHMYRFHTYTYIS